MQLIAIRNILVFLFVACFFFFPRLQTIFISLAFLLTFFTGEFKGFKKLVLENKLSLAFLSYFLFGLLSMLWTENTAEGWKGIEIKFSFFAFPLFLPLIFGNKKFESTVLINVLTISALFYVMLSFLGAFFGYLDQGKISIFFGSTLGFRLFQDGPFVHPTYVSFYYLTLILIWGKNLIDSDKMLVVKSKLGKMAILSVFVIFVFFSSSKAGFLGIGIITLLLLGLFAKRERKIAQALGLLIFFGAVTVVGIYTTNLKNKFEQAYTELTDPNLKPDANLKSTGARIWIWKATNELIKENLVYGLGLGDTRSALLQKYKEMGIKSLEDSELDSHQQFLQTFATLGVIGLLLLLMLFVWIFWYSWKHKNFLLLGFGLIYFLFGLTESMLETQAGIIFFTFFTFFLYRVYTLPKSIQNA